MESSFFNPLEVMDNFVPSPPNLNRPVKSMSDKCDKIGLVTFGEPVPFQELLVDIAKLGHDEYHAVLMQWLCDHLSQLPAVHNWFATRGLTLEDYCKHMLDNGCADRLEVWLLCIAMNMNINVVQEDHIWSAMR